MLKGKLIHPQLMAALSACGHGDKILIADGNYPLDSKTTDAELIYLGLTPGLPTPVRASPCHPLQGEGFLFFKKRIAFFENL